MTVQIYPQSVGPKKSFTSRLKSAFTVRNIAWTLGLVLVIGSVIYFTGQGGSYKGLSLLPIQNLQPLPAPVEEAPAAVLTNVPDIKNAALQTIPSLTLKSIRGASATEDLLTETSLYKLPEPPASTPQGFVGPFQPKSTESEASSSATIGAIIGAIETIQKKEPAVNCLDIETSLKTKLEEFEKNITKTDLADEIQKFYKENYLAMQKKCTLSEDVKKEYDDLSLCHSDWLQLETADSNVLKTIVKEMGDLACPVTTEYQTALASTQKCSASGQDAKKLSDLFAQNSLEEAKTLYDSMVTKDPNCKSANFEAFFSKIDTCKNLLTQFKDAVDEEDKDLAESILEDDIKPTCGNITMSNEMKTAYENLIADNISNRNNPPQIAPPPVAPPADCGSYFEELSTAIDDNQKKDAELLHANAMIAGCITPPDLQGRYTILMNAKTDAGIPKKTNLPAWGSEGEWANPADQTQQTASTAAAQTAAAIQTPVQKIYSTTTIAAAPTATKTIRPSASKRIKKTAETGPEALIYLLFAAASYGSAKFIRKK